MMLSSGSTCVLLVLLSAPAPASASETAFVWPDGSGDYPTISAAVQAMPEGGTVYLLPGTYTGPGNRDVPLSGKNVSLRSFGGSAVIDCQGQGRALLLGEGVDSSTIVEGIEFRNGVASPGFGGGAVSCTNAGPTLTGCVFTGNSATYGGALRTTGEPAPVVMGCRFTENTAVYGGALDASGVEISIQSTTMAENSASFGGAMMLTDCLSEIVRCTLCRNAAASGGALRLDGSEAVIDRCIIAYNLQNEAIVGEENSETSYSCLFANADGDQVDGFAHDNSVGDPRMCSVETGDYHLCLNSYCLPAHNPWGYHIGHEAQGCGGCETLVTPASWGTIKALYR